MSEEEARKLAVDHLWRWFELHAAQRLTTFNFFVVLVAALCAGYFAALQANRPAMAAAISIIGLVTTPLFKALDDRNRHLIKIGESALREQEEALCQTLMSQQLKVFQSAEKKPPMIFSFRQVFNALFGIVMVASVIALFASIKVLW